MKRRRITREDAAKEEESSLAKRSRSTEADPRAKAATSLTQLANNTGRNNPRRQPPVQHPTVFTAPPESTPLWRRRRRTKYRIADGDDATPAALGTRVHSPSPPNRRSPSRRVGPKPLIHPSQRRHHPRSATAGRPRPTIYTPRTERRGSPTLPPPKRPAEGQRADGLAGDGARERELLLLAFLAHCSTGKGGEGDS